MKEIIAHYAWIIIGVLLGAAAHFGRIIARDGFPPARLVLGYSLQLGMVAIVSAVVTERTGLENMDAALCSAIMAISTNEIFNFARIQARKWLDRLGG